MICALSGGVDSAVAAALVHRAVGDQLTCVFVDNGLMRREEPERVVETFGRHMQDATLSTSMPPSGFSTQLAGVTDPEQKRKHRRRDVHSRLRGGGRQARRGRLHRPGHDLPGRHRERAAATAAAAKIKSHHNVGGLPKELTFELIEPLRYLFKDEVRQVGLALGLPDEMVYRQPFPGPGLAIRIIGEVTEESVDALRRRDWIVMDEIKAGELYHDLWQAFAVLTDTRTVGVMGDFRTYGHVVALRAVTAEDAMTADWARLPYDVLARISSRIVNEVPGVNRVVYDITSKPPGTIEWE